MQLRWQGDSDRKDGGCDKPMDVINVLRLVIGFIICMFGSVVLRSSPRVGGFLLGGLIGAEAAVRFLAAPAGYELFFPLVSFLLAGGIGALIAAPLYMVMLVLSSSALGALIGMVAGLIVSMQGVTRAIVEAFLRFELVNDFQLTLIIIFALVMALISLRSEEFMSMASTAYVGAVLVVSGLSGLFGNSLLLLSDGIFVFFFWMVLGLIGLIYQNRYSD